VGRKTLLYLSIYLLILGKAGYRTPLIVIRHGTTGQPQSKENL